MSDKAVKADAGKLPWDLYAWDAAEGTVRVLRHGAKKYAPRNWEKGMDYSRIYAALMRHMVDWWNGQDLDPESGELTLDHVGCCIMFLQAHVRRGLGNDDRPKLNNSLRYLSERDKLEICQPLQPTQTNEDINKMLQEEAEKALEEQSKLNPLSNQQHWTLEDLS